MVLFVKFLTDIGQNKGVKMIHYRSVFWFLLRNWRNNVIFFTGNLLIFSLEYMIFCQHSRQIFSNDPTWLPIFLFVALISVIYNLIFYFNQSGRIGLLLLYGATKFEILTVIFIENISILILSVILNLFIFAIFDFLAFLFLMGMISILSLISSIKYFFSDIYKIVRE